MDTSALTSWRIFSGRYSTTLSIRFGHDGHDHATNTTTAYRRIPPSRLQRDTERQREYFANLQQHL